MDSLRGFGRRHCEEGVLHPTAQVVLAAHEWRVHAAGSVLKDAFMSLNVPIASFMTPAFRDIAGRANTPFAALGFPSDAMKGAFLTVRVMKAPFTARPRAASDPPFRT
ncbi:hypothetical protein [Actinophytocola sp.]|uniref:hypothetical protein n=1 Tax=Actinophytocola sp. TaxID=1872138 RepID=UPI002ED0AC06